jgi:hypothetical protein
MKRALSILLERQTIVGILLFTVGFIAARLPYYLQVNIPYVFDDAPVYMSNVNELQHGGVGMQGLTLGYPAFLALCRLFTSDITVVTYVQSSVTLIVGLSFILMIHKSFRYLVLPSSIALTIFTTSILFVHFETSILTECLFANSVILTSGALALILSEISIGRMLLFSTSVVVSMLIRPVGLYLVPLWFLVGVYIYCSTRHGKQIAVYLAPLLGIYMLSAAQRLISNENTVGSGGLVASLATNALSYLETDPTLPNHVNQVIQSYVRPLQVRQQQDYIRSGTDVQQVSALYLLYQRYADGFRDTLLAKNSGSMSGLQSDYSKILNVILRKNTKDLYRFFKIQFLHYFDSFDYKRTSAYPFFVSYKACFQDARIVVYSQHEYYKTGYIGRQRTYRSPGYTMQSLQSKYDDLSASKLSSYASDFFLRHHKLFRRHAWLYACAIAAVLGILLALKNSGYRQLGLLLILLTSSSIFYMAVVSVNISMIRYNFPLHFQFYLVPLIAVGFLFHVYLPNGRGQMAGGSTR